MAKRNPVQQKGQKKSLVSKKAEIEKLVDLSKASSSIQSKLTSRNTKNKNPSRQPTARDAKSRPSKPNQGLRDLAPKPIVPGLPGLDYASFLLCDRRSYETPGVTLIRLPSEPSIPRALRYERKGHFPFLQLAGEIRNKIYDYIIAEDSYLVDWIDQRQKSKSLTYKSLSLKLRGPRLRPDAAQHRRSLDFYRRRLMNKHLSPKDICPGPTALLFVCKQMSEEAASVLYSKCMFKFVKLGTLRHFLDHLRPNTMRSIRKVSIVYHAYRNPAKITDRYAKKNHDRLWEDLCWRLADNCSLTDLNLDITLNKSPVSFATLDQLDPLHPGHEWMKPLWAFQDAGPEDVSIKRCWLRLRCESFETQWNPETWREEPSEVLGIESQNLRRQILGEQWDEEAEKDRDYFGVSKGTRDTPALKKSLVLRLRADGTPEVE